MGADGSNKQHVVIVGGGLAGISCAAECMSQGLRVTIIDRNGHLGGKMNVLEDKGYSFDMGPTILTLPQVLRGILRRAGRRVEDCIDLINLDPQWRCFYDDGTVINLRKDPRDTVRELDRQFPGAGAGQGFEAFLAFSRRMMRLSEKVFFYQDLGGIMDMMMSPPKEPGIMKDAMAMRPHATVASTINAYIKEPHVRQMCEHFLQYVGSSPFMAPAILSLIAAAQADHGCWYSMPGKNAAPGTRGGTRLPPHRVERPAGLRTPPQRGPRPDRRPGAGTGGTGTDASPVQRAGRHATVPLAGRGRLGRGAVPRGQLHDRHHQVLPWPAPSRPRRSRAQPG